MFETLTPNRSFGDTQLNSVIQILDHCHDNEFGRNWTKISYHSAWTRDMSQIRAPLRCF